MEATVLIPLLVFATIVLGTIAFVSVSAQSERRRRLVEKIRTMGAAHRPAAASAQPAAATGRPATGPWEHLLALAASVGRAYPSTRGEEAGDLPPDRTFFFRAGYRGKRAPLIYAGAKLLGAAGLPAALVVTRFFVQTPMAPLHLAIALGLSAVAGFYLPAYL